MKKLLLLLPLFFCATLWGAASDTPAIQGYWQILDDNGKPESIAVLYPYEGQYFCRIVAIYDENTGKVTETFADPKEKASGIPGNPPICGLDFIWNLKSSDGGKHFQGTVIDPDNGNTYVCKVWYDASRKTLVVRGEWLIFGENEYWPPLSVEQVPEAARVDMKKLKPVIPPQS